MIQIQICKYKPHRYSSWISINHVHDVLLNKIYSYSSWSRVNPPSGQWGCTCWVWYLLFPGAKFSFQIEHVKLHERNHTTSSSLSCQKWDEFSGFIFLPQTKPSFDYIIVCGHMPWLKKKTWLTQPTVITSCTGHVAPPDTQKQRSSVPCDLMPRLLHEVHQCTRFL